MKPVGVFKRGDVWWYRIGRKHRKSSGSMNVEDAVLLRARAVAAMNNRLVLTDWKREVEQQSETSKTWLRKTYASVLRRTRGKGWTSCLTLQELSQILLQSGGRCAVTGLRFTLSAKVRDPFAASLDRIDSSLGYNYGNVRIVLLAVNLAMSHWGEESLMIIARALIGRDLIKMGDIGRHLDKSTGEGE